MPATIRHPAVHMVTGKDETGRTAPIYGPEPWTPTQSTLTNECTHGSLILDLVRRTFRERPFAEPAGANQVERGAGCADSSGYGQAAERVDTVDEDEDKPGHGGQRWQRIERDAEGARKIGALDA